jgi:histidyl-tRNA synthetase
VQQYLQQMKIEYRINPAIVRGLDYYTNTAFEFIFEGLGAQNTLAGGGRYNYLIEQIGGKPTPAIGFAGGFERLLLALEEEGVALPMETKPTAYLICAGEAALAFAMPMLRDLRAAGIWVDYNADKTSFKAQMKASDQSGARFAIIIGEDELQEGIVTLKNLQSGEQLRLAPADLPGVLLKD